MYIFVYMCVYAVVVVSPRIHLHLHPSASPKCTVAEDGKRESLYKTLATFPETARPL